MRKPYKLLFKYTSKNRVPRFINGLNSIVNNLEDKKNYSIVCTFNEEDNSYNNPDFISILDSYKNLTYYFNAGITSKVQAINTNLDKLPPFNIIVNMSDDMVFIQQGFDNIIRKAFEDNFPDGDGFIHFHDNNQERLSIMTVEGKKYLERFGWIYHPSYISLWCDVEAQETAQKLKKYKYMGDDVRIFTHLHPLHGHTQYRDKNYKYTESFYAQDHVTFSKRKINNFGL